MFKIYFALFAATLLMAGCANSATRFAFDPGEGVYTYSHDVNVPSSESYYLAEEWLSTNITRANEVISLRQPETGILIATPSLQVPLGLTSMWGKYTLKVTCQDTQVITQFTLHPLDGGYYPPKSAMHGIETKFKLLSFDLAEFIRND